MCITVLELLSLMLNLQYIVWGIAAASREETRVDEPLCTIAGFGLCTQEGLTNSCKEAEKLCKNGRQPVEVERLCERLY